MDRHMFNHYTAFVVTRHRLWEARQLDIPLANATVDTVAGQVVARNKFTNVFRVLDHGSQFLVQSLLYGDDVSPADQAMRCFLYRYTNRPEPWAYFYTMHGRMPRLLDLDNYTLHNTWRTFVREGGKVFGPAYKMFVGHENKGWSRLEWALDLTRRAFIDDEYGVMGGLGNVTSVEDTVLLLQNIPRCARFMSMQVATDLGYTDWMEADENTYVLPGPGCVRGVQHLQPAWATGDVLEWMRSYLRNYATEVRLTLPGGGYRYPSLMDVQNTFCEFSKYVRYLQQPARKPYKPKHGWQRPTPFLPPHWNHQLQR